MAIAAPTSPTEEHPRLERLIGARAIALNAINTTVGAGIFGLPAVAAAELGHAAPVAYVVTALLFAMVALCFAEAGSRVSSAGGLYAYSSAAFGPLAGSFVGTLLWLANGAVSNAAVAVLLVDNVAAFVPGLASPAIRTVVIVSIYVVIAVVNVRGVREGVRLSEAMTVIKLLPLVLLAAVGVATIGRFGFPLPAWPTVGQLGRGVVLLTFTFMGMETALSPSGEIRDPARSVPRGILGCTAAVAALYLTLQLVAEAALGPALPTSTAAPLAATASIVLGGWGKVLLLGAGIACMAGVLPGDLLGTPRVLFAMANDGLLPGWLGRIHPRRNTPATAIITYAVVACGFALSGTFKSLALVSASGTLVMYLVTCLAVPVLRRKGVAGAGAPFRIRGGPLVPLLAAGTITFVLTTLRRAELLAVGSILVVSLLPFVVRRLRSGPG